jgi:hypothetical protein
MEDNIVNKVAQSTLVTINPEDFYPEGIRTEIDIADQLIEGFLLREKDFREYIKVHDWSSYKDHYVAVFCSTDAIIPLWAWMLISTVLQPFAKKTVFGNAQTLEAAIFHDAVSNIDVESFRDQRIVIKGCSDKPVPVSFYMELTNLLKPVAQSILFGEPCSTVPVFKRSKL